MNRLDRRDQKGKKHDHRSSLWLIANGRLMWCYQCGAWAYNVPIEDRRVLGPAWYRPTGIGGPNPATIKRSAKVSG